ncbi:hypothetical protein ACQ4PT_053633 [Festuca glaucescens]
MAGLGSDQRGHRAGKEPVMEETIDEKIGRLKLTESESKKQVIDNREEDASPSWSLAGKVLSRKVFHINAISEILRPALGNPKGLLFRDGGPNMFVAKFATERDRERVWERSPWTVSKQACILENFVDCQRPAEIRFDKLLIWVRVLNLPFNLLNSTWGDRIAKEISDDVVRVDVNKQGLTSGGFLRARVWIKVDVPLRRCIAIDSSRRESCDWYELEYEGLPYFCFSCGLIGHADIFCPNPESANMLANDNVPSTSKGAMSLEEEARAANAEFWQVPSRQEEVEVEADEVAADRRMSEAEEEDEPTTTDDGDHTTGDSTDFGDRT